MGLDRDTLAKDNHHSVPGHIGIFRRGSRYGCDYNGFSKASDLVPYNRLLTKQTASSVGSRVVILVREFLAGRTQMVRVGGQLFKEVKVIADVS